jgi:hypothetical protein
VIPRRSVTKEDSDHSF